MSALQRQMTGIQPKLKLTLSSSIQGTLQKVSNWVASLYGKDETVQEASLVIQLYPKHFTLGNEKIAHSYNGPLHSFLDCVNQERIPAEFMDLFEQNDIKFHQGCLIVDIYDHRPSTLGHVTNHAIDTKDIASPMSQSNSQSFATQTTYLDSQSQLPNDMTLEMAEFFETPIVKTHEEKTPHVEEPRGYRLKRVHLKPDDSTIWASIELMAEKTMNNARPMTQDDALEIESLLIHRLNPEINLDPNPKVFHEACEVNFDRCKSYIFAEDSNLRIYGRKRKHAEQDEVESSLMDYMDTRVGAEFHPSFKQQSFREEWNKKKKLSEDDVLLSLDMPNYKQLRKAAKANPGGTLYFNTLRLIRSIRFESRGQYAKKTVHTLLNIYEKPGDKLEAGKDRDQFIAVLRWGSARDKGDGGLEWYPIGNHIATEYYLTHFKGFYEIQHQTISDTQDSVKTQKLLQQRQLQQQAQVIMAQQQLNQGKIQIGLDKMQRVPSVNPIPMQGRPPTVIPRPVKEVSRMSRPSSVSSLPGLETGSPPMLNAQMDQLQQQLKQARPPQPTMDIGQLLKTLVNSQTNPQNALINSLVQPRPPTQPSSANLAMLSMLQNAQQNQKLQAQGNSAQQITSQMLQRPQQPLASPPTVSPTINPPVSTINPQVLNNPQVMNQQITQALALQNLLRTFASNPQSQQQSGSQLIQNQVQNQLAQNQLAQNQLAQNQLAQNQLSQQTLVRLLQNQLINQTNSPNVNLGQNQHLGNQLLAALVSQSVQSPQVSSPQIALSPPPNSPLLTDKRGRGRGKK
jgi:hypothetical protein